MQLHKNWKNHFKKIILPLFLCFSLLLYGCKSAPNDVEEAKTKILELGLTLSYTEDADDLAEVLDLFDFEYEGKLIAYLIGINPIDDSYMLEVMFFEYEQDAKNAIKVIRSKISDRSKYGRDGAQIWYGDEVFVEEYLKNQDS